MTHREELAAVFEPLDLAIRLDVPRGLAIVVVRSAEGGSEGGSEGGDEWSHPLVRRQRMTLEQSVGVAILRQLFSIHERNVGIGGGNVRVVLEDVMPQRLVYFDDSGSDGQNKRRVRSSLDQLKTHGLVSPLDANDESTISPLIVYVADASSPAELLKVLRQPASTRAPAEGPSEDRSIERFDGSADSLVDSLVNGFRSGDFTGRQSGSEVEGRIGAQSANELKSHRSSGPAMQSELFESSNAESRPALGTGRGDMPDSGDSYILLHPSLA